MRRTICQSSVSILIKFLNYLQTFVGVSVLLYSLWMLTDSHQPSAPWFVYAVMSFGVLLCLVAFIGYIAVVAMNGFCLCFYAVLASMLILLQISLLADLVFNSHWEEDLPTDASGKLKILRAFIEDNKDMCKWIAIVVVVIQAVSLSLAVILRSMVHPRSLDVDSDEDSTSITNPLLNPNSGSNSTSTSVDSTTIPRDSWQYRMKQKYGLVPSPPPNDAAASSPANGWRKYSIRGAGNNKAV